MLIQEQVDTAVTPDRAWELIRDPWLHGRWNSNILETEVLTQGPAALGFRYRVTYELSGKKTQFDAEITEFRPGERWTARLEERVKGDGRHFDRYMVESYTIHPQVHGAHVVHEVHIHNSGVHPALRFMAWLVMKTGRPVGKPFMERFRELAEGSAPGQKAA
jgi:hypothetical protein